jgi:flagellar biogenesis protein FliO
MQLRSSAALAQVARPADPRPLQPASSSEVIVALAVIVAMALLIFTGFVMGRRQQRRRARSRIRTRQVNKRIDSRHLGQQRTLRLVGPKRR